MLGEYVSDECTQYENKKPTVQYNSPLQRITDTPDGYRMPVIPLRRLLG